MNKQKVNDFVTAYATAIGLSESNKTLLIELMENIIQKYEKEIPPIPVSIDPCTSYIIKPVNGHYSVEDFFLNRLMRNIWSVSEITPKVIEEGFADVHTKGQFDSLMQEVSFNIPKTAKQLEKYKDTLGVRYEEMRRRTFKKVVMHEFEHGLQTVYQDDLDFNLREKYQKIIDELKKYPQYKKSIRSYEEMPKEFGVRNTYISTGAYYSSTAEKKGIKTYRHIEGYENLNEILNETESIEMASQDAGLYKLFNRSGNYFSLRNPESSNAEITNYGFLLKTLLGSKKAFTLMYLNPSKAYEFFNNVYGEIFKEAYGSDKDAIEILIECLTQIKQTGSEEAHLKLTETLTKCIEKKISMQMESRTASTEQLLGDISVFENNTITNDDEIKRRNLEHVKLLSSLKRRVMNQEKTTEKDQAPNKELLPVPSFEEVKSLTEQYELVVDPDTSTINIVDRTTKEKVEDPKLVSLALFSNIWLISAGVKKNFNENIPGAEYAFNDGAKRTYDFFVDSMISSLEETGGISTIDMFKNSEFFQYKYTQEIMVNLFRTDFQTKFLEDFFQKRCNHSMESTKTAKPLYNLSYAGQLAYGKNTSNKMETSGTKK